MPEADAQAGSQPEIVNDRVPDDRHAVIGRAAASTAVARMGLERVEGLDTVLAALVAGQLRALEASQKMPPVVAPHSVLEARADSLSAQNAELREALVATLPYLMPGAGESFHSVAAKENLRVLIVRLARGEGA